MRPLGGGGVGGLLFPGEAERLWSEEGQPQARLRDPPQVGFNPSIWKIPPRVCKQEQPILTQTSLLLGPPSVRPILQVSLNKIPQHRGAKAGPSDSRPFPRVSGPSWSRTDPPPQRQVLLLSHYADRETEAPGEKNLLHYSVSGIHCVKKKTEAQRSALP